MDHLEAYRRNLRRMAAEKNLTQKEIAIRADISETHVGMMMNGTRNPTLRTAVNVAHALGVTLSEMLEGAEYVEY